MNLWVLIPLCLTLCFASAAAGATVLPASAHSPIDGGAALFAAAGAAAILPAAHPLALIGQNVQITALTIAPNPASVPQGQTITLTATITDTSVSPTTPIGNVTWTDVAAGGSFNLFLCHLTSASSSTSQCSVVYTPPLTLGKVTVSASYGGDSVHSSSATRLGINVFVVLNAVSVNITPTPKFLFIGKAVTFTASVADISSSPIHPTGSVLWNDGGAGGSFSQGSCNLVTNGSLDICSSVYTAPASPALLAVTASYSGDALHPAGSSGFGLQALPLSVDFRVSALIVGSTKGASAPVFTYSLSNVTRAVVLTATPISLSVDTNSMWFAPNQLGNSTQAEAWNLVGQAQGTATYSFGAPSGATTLAFVYYHQYSVGLGYQIVGGSAGASVPPFVTWTSFGVTRTTGAPGGVWVDVGTTYAYPAQLPGSLGDVRWLANGTSGTVSAGANLSPTYYHQFKLSVSYQVKNPPGKVTAPTMFAEAMGLRFNASLNALTSKTWLDAGSTYSLTDPLLGGNSSVRWSAGSAASGTVVNSNVAITYYRQFSMSASAMIAGGPPPTRLVRGAPVDVVPTISGFSGNKNASFPLGTQSQAVWLDGGSSYSISKVLFVAPTERWVATAGVTGVVAPGAIATQTYYDQYLLRVSYSASVAPSFVPAFTYASLGTQASSQMVPQGSTVWADAGTSFLVQDSLLGDRWFAPDAQGGLASSANMTVTFYHQYQIDVSLKVVGGGLPAPSFISGTSGGQPLKAVLGTEKSGVWLDSGTSYIIPQKALQLPEERWIASADLTGTMTSPTAVTQTYYHQNLLNLSSSGAAGPAPPTVGYVAFGVQAQSPIGPAKSAIWADVGTKFSVQNAIPGGQGERWYSGLLGGNVTTPVSALAHNFHQYLLNYSFTAVGGTMSAPPSIAAVQAGKDSSFSLTNRTGQVWLDVGTHWEAALVPGLNQQGQRWLSTTPTQGTIDGPVSLHLNYVLQFFVTTASSPSGGGTVSPGGWYNASSDIALHAIPAQNWALGGWNGVGGGAYSGRNATLSIPVLSAMNETAVFQPSLTIISSNGGSVKYTTGPSAQSIGAGRSVQTFVPGGENVTLQALSSFPYQFVKWSGVDGHSSDLLSLSVNSPTVIQAVFAPSLVYIIGLPAGVFASALTIYLGRGFILASGRQVFRNLRGGKKPPNGSSSAPLYQIPDDLWSKISAFLPAYAPKKPANGRPRISDRKGMNAIFYMMRDERQWNDLPREYGNPIAVHEKFQVWRDGGLFQKLRDEGITEYDADIIEQKWQSIGEPTTLPVVQGETTSPLVEKDSKEASGARSAVASDSSSADPVSEKETSVTEMAEKLQKTIQKAQDVMALLKAQEEAELVEMEAELVEKKREKKGQ